MAVFLMMRMRKRTTMMTGARLKKPWKSKPSVVSGRERYLGIVWRRENV
jgi:hypothetical protein